MVKEYLEKSRKNWDLRVSNEAKILFDRIRFCKFLLESINEKTREKEFIAFRTFGELIEFSKKNNFRSGKIIFKDGKKKFFINEKTGLRVLDFKSNLKFLKLYFENLANNIRIYKNL